MPAALISLLAACMLAAPAAFAAEDYDADVQYLLSFVQTSGCTFVRNGSAHESADAADHLRLKYDRGSRYVKSAEQFIDRLATESSWSGKPYTVTCGDHTQPSADWLYQALETHRKQAE